MSGVSTRDRLIDAAERAIGRFGLPGATTKRIAAEAGCSEALLYKHFPDKESLFLAVVLERQPALGPSMAHLRAGAGDLAERLTDFAVTAVEFYTRVAGLASGMLADPSLLARFRETLAAKGTGPHVPILALAQILEGERGAGRLDRAIDPRAAAAMLLGACFHRANLSYFVSLPEETRAWAAGLVATLLRR
jgi:AcrR family transcriptional regulator